MGSLIPPFHEVQSSGAALSEVAQPGWDCNVRSILNRGMKWKLGWLSKTPVPLWEKEFTGASLETQRAGLRSQGALHAHLYSRAQRSKQRRGWDRQDLQGTCHTDVCSVISPGLENASAFLAVLPDPGLQEWTLVSDSSMASSSMVSAVLILSGYKRITWNGCTVHWQWAWGGTPHRMSVRLVSHFFIKIDLFI